MQSHGPSSVVPPFTESSALAKVKAAQDAWNTRDPERVSLAYTEDSQWRNRTEFFTGRAAIVSWLMRRRDMSANDYAIAESERRYRTDG